MKIEFKKSLKYLCSVIIIAQLTIIMLQLNRKSGFTCRMGPDQIVYCLQR